MEKSNIGDEVVAVIPHDSAKCSSTKMIQMATLVGSDAPRFTAM